MNLSKSCKVCFYVLLTITIISIPISIFAGLVLAPALAIIVFSVIVLQVISRKEILSQVISSLAVKRQKCDAAGGSINGRISHLENPSCFLRAIIFLFIGWGGLSCLWSINGSVSLQFWFRVVLVILPSLYVIYCLQKCDISLFDKQKFTCYFGYSFIFSAVILLIESLSAGSFVGELLNYISPNQFEFHDLNRGACYLALLLWVFISVKGVSFFSLILYCVTAIAIFYTDSLSALLGLVVSSCVFIGCILFRKIFRKIFITVTILIVLGFPVIFQSINIIPIIEKYNLPDSAVHRLLIWDFVADKTLQNKDVNSKILGYGIHSSRYVDGAGDKIISPSVEIKDYWVNIPLHPHNSVMQILLELGLIGLVLYGLLIIAIYRVIIAANYDKVQEAAILAIMSCYIAISLVGFGVLQNWWISAPFLIIFILVVGRNMHNQPQSR